MTRDLFGNIDRQAERRVARERDRSHKPIPVPRGPPPKQQFFRVGGRSFSIAEVYEAVGFHRTCREMPDHDLVVVINTGIPPPHEMYIVALPRNHPSRFDAQGRRDPARAPFWGHGEVMYIEGREVAV